MCGTMVNEHVGVKRGQGVPGAVERDCQWKLTAGTSSGGGTQAVPTNCSHVRCKIKREEEEQRAKVNVRCCLALPALPTVMAAHHSVSLGATHTAAAAG